jgi:hypothetical protein
MITHCTQAKPGEIFSVQAQPEKSGGKVMRDREEREMGRWGD